MTNTSKTYFYQSYSKRIYIENEKVYSDSESVVLKPDETPEAKARELTREHYSKLLSNPFENIVVFCGAGTSKSSGGKSMYELWEEVKDLLTEPTLTTLYSDIKLPYPTNDAEKDIEKLLSQAYMAVQILIDPTSTRISSQIEQIETHIRAACDLKLNNTTHLEFLNKLTARKSKYSRIKVFTLNYDQLFEQAGIEGKYIVIDGFSFSLPRYFDPTFFDYDLLVRDTSKPSRTNNYVKKVFHLYKPHGSINWENQEDSNQIVIKEDPKKSLMIFPNTDKYEHSYEQPFFEMTSRFQRSLRLENTLLVCIGFSFNDKHFKNVITEACISNPSLTLVIVLPKFEEKSSVKGIIELTKSQNNIVLIDEKFEEFVKVYPYPEEYGYEQQQQPQQQPTKQL